MTVTADALIQRLTATREAVAEATIRAGRTPDAVSVVAVSKYHPVAAIAALAAAGQHDFGENYAQEALRKQEDLAEHGLRWHFIGRVQTNKAKYLAGRFHLVHSVDSLKLARALHKRAQNVGARQPILLQVNLAEEERKGGASEKELPAIAEEVMQLASLELMGLMTMPPYFDEPHRSRPLFARLRELKDLLETQLGKELPHLSMGMTHDFDHAVAEGATLVRIGTRIFGPRPVK